jgi:hypothetical protein
MKAAMRLGWALLLLMQCTGPRSYAADAGALEYAVKANFLYKFGDYITWPPQALGPANGPVTICVAGSDPFGTMLDEAVAGEVVAQRPIFVKRLATVTPDAGCHILYIGPSPSQSIAAALQAVAGQPVLTITDSAFEDTGIINFLIRDNRVRFSIDQQAAAAGGLEISSKLLSLAVTVRRAGP